MRTLTALLFVVVPWGVTLHAGEPHLLRDALVGIGIGVALAVAYVVGLRRLFGPRDRDPARDQDHRNRGSSGS